MVELELGLCEDQKIDREGEEEEEGEDSTSRR